LRLRLIREGLLESKRNRCQLTQWNGLPIPLELEHKNGIHTDNSIENLELLCPNCHAQTLTCRGKNKKK
jgi:5-methylcytosine-specific restriction endonuclease McrA